MFSKHVTRNISAYCHGELTSDESKLLAEHLIACNKCRTEFEHIKAGIKFAGELPLLSAPDSLWTEIASRLAVPSVKKLDSPQRYSLKSWQVSTAVAALLLITLGVGLYLTQRTSKESSVAFWNVERINGRPTVGATGIENRGKLEIGQWLETDSTSKAQIGLNSVGQIQIDPNTRVRLVQTQPTEHRLELAQGKVSAHIWAPPKLFFVNTPSAVAADLGCAYTLEVDDAGRSLLRVTAGWVALELKDRESMVPSGAACETRPGIGPGTPYFEDAGEEFRRALEKVDFETATEKSIALTTVIDLSRSRDTLTLWHLLSRVEGRERERVYEKIASFVPPPSDVTREGVLQLDQRMLQRWRYDLERSWNGNTLISKPVAETFWKVKNGVNRQISKFSPQ